MNQTERNRLNWQKIKNDPVLLKNKQVKCLEYYYNNHERILAKMRDKYHERKDKELFEFSNDDEKQL
jgi:hypothetical protein